MEDKNNMIKIKRAKICICINHGGNSSSHIRCLYIKVWDNKLKNSIKMLKNPNKSVKSTGNSGFLVL
ncbi:hypothetical protein [Agathobacter sp.]